MTFNRILRISQWLFIASLSPGIFLGPLLILGDGWALIVEKWFFGAVMPIALFVLLLIMVSMLRED